MSDDLIFQPVASLVERVRSRQVSVLEVVDAHIRRIEAVNGALNAVVTCDFDRARRDARTADEQISRGEPIGALGGVPVTIKDAINTAGLRTVAGSRLFVDNVPPADATAVRRLRAAGAIVLGKTNVPECAMDWRTTNPVFGRTNNPWNVEYSPGGSSGGETAAVAAGCSTGGLGTDLGGSIRVPAHFCGICGLRPTPGRVPASGYALPASGPMSLAHSVGPLARSVDDLQLLFGVLAGFDPCDPVSVVASAPSAIGIHARGLRLAVCADGGIPVTAETRQAVERAAHLLTECGADVAPWSLPAVAEVPQVFSDWLLQPSLPALLALYRGREEAMGPLMRGLATLAQPRSLERFLDAWSARDVFRRSILERLDQRPVLVMPVCSTPAFRHDHRGPLPVDGRSVDYAVSFGYAEVASIASLPAVTVPVSRTPAGLPVGVQLIGRPFDEPLLLAVARLLEEAAGPFAHPSI
jgi:amidase